MYEINTTNSNYTDFIIPRNSLKPVVKPDYCKARVKKNCNTFIGVYIRNCKQIIKKSKEMPNL